MATQSGHTGARAVVMDGPYAGADLELGRRGSGIVAVVSGALSLVLFAFAPPTHGLGAFGGWAVGGLLALATLAAGVALLRPPARVSFGRLAQLQWLALGSLALLVWLTGGISSPQIALTLLWMVAFAALHPTRPLVVYLLASAALTCAPLAYDAASVASGGEVFARLGVWIFMAGIAHNFMTGVRRDRLERERGSQRATELARVDPLTGLGNRRAFDEALRIQIQRSRAEGTPLSVVVADIRSFKDINDRFGHLAGDHCLRDVASTVAGETRQGEPAYRTYRWGGDEFAVPLPGATRAQAEVVAARISNAVDRLCADPDGGPLRLGCGCAELQPGMDAEDLLDQADLALIARRGGRANLRAADAG